MRKTLLKFLQYALLLVSLCAPVPAQSFISRLYAEKLTATPQAGFGVLFSAGGTGAGKKKWPDQ